MRGKLLGFALALLSVATVGVVQLNANAYVDNGRDCDQFAVIRCGTMSAQEARNKYDEGSKIFSHFGISKAEISGNLKDGVVYENGNVVVGGKVVATGAKTAIRNMSGGNKIAGTNAAVYPASRMGSAQTAIVKFDKNGRFLFAIMKPCGNPVVATPTQPKPSADCKNLAIDKIERTKYRFNAKAEAKNGATINSYTFTVKRQGKVVENKTQKSASYVFNAPSAGNYKVTLTVNTSEGKKSGRDCEKEFTVPTERDVECKSLTKQKLSDNRYQFTAQATVNRVDVKGYLFEVFEGSNRIASKTVTTSKLSANYTYSQSKPGTYTVKVTVKSSKGNVSGPNCARTFTVPEEPEVPTPAAECESLTVEKLSDTSFRFDGAATVENDATVSKYTFDVQKDGVTVDSIPVNSSDLTASTTYEQSTPGDYTVRLTVQTSLGAKTNDNCVKAFTVEKPPVEENPGVDITKTVEGVKYIRVGVNVEYDYQIVVTNTGDIDLENVLVTDTPQQGITLTGASEGSIAANNTWTFTIPELTVGASKSFTLSAKVPEYLAGKLTNTVCVDAPEVPGNPDDCDEADVDVPPKETPEDVVVCNPEDGTIITVPKEDEDKYVPVDSPECKEIQVCVLETKEVETIKKSDFDSKLRSTDLTDCEETPVTPVTPVAPAPTELPYTGPAEVAAQIIGAMSLAGANAYYFTSRRSN